MTAAYVPQAGDRVQRASWYSHEHFDVTAVGRGYFLGINDDGYESARSLSGEWIKVETPTPLPERWQNVSTQGFITTYRTNWDADRYAADDRIACIHIWTDADGVDRIERVTA